jgi:hypothetical protein
VERMTIVEFLNARLRDDEAYALEAAKEFGPDWIEIWSGQIDLSANLPERQPPDNRPWDAHVQTNDSRVSRYMVRHDPARVLREVAAKRKIVAWHSSQHNVGGTVWDPAAQFCSTCGDQCTHVGEARCEACGYDDGCPTVLLLASVYDGHPDYEQAWRVDG